MGERKIPPTVFPGHTGVSAHESSETWSNSSVECYMTSSPSPSKIHSKASSSLNRGAVRLAAHQMVQPLPSALILCKV